MFLGIDAGSPDSYICIVNQAKEIIIEDKLSACNLANDTLEETSDFLIRIINQHTSIQAVSIGLAGWDESDKQAQLIETIKSKTHLSALEVISNALLNLFKFDMTPPCITVRSDTGSIAYGLDFHSKPFKFGGYGSYFGDSGSGFDIAKSAIKKALKELDLGNITPLYKSAHKHFNTESINQLLAKQDNIGEVSSFADTVNKLALAGDPLALSCIKDAALSLITHIEAAITKQYLPSSGFSIGLYGSCLHKGSALSILLEEELTHRFKVHLVESNLTASQAAAHRALKLITR